MAYVAMARPHHYDNFFFTREAPTDLSRSSYRGPLEIKTGTAERSNTRRIRREFPKMSFQTMTTKITSGDGKQRSTICSSADDNF